MNLGRPRKLEPEAVLQLALDVFWDKGYEATSLSDLMAATGLHKGSLYQTFGDKKSLFMAALKAYLDDIYQLQSNVIHQAKTPLGGLCEAMHSMLEYTYQEGEHGHRGCMAVNTLVETAPHDEEIFLMMQKQHEKFEKLIRDTLLKAQSKDELNTQVSIDTIYGLLMTTMCGLSMHVKNLMSLDDARHLLNQQLLLMGLTQ